MNIRKNMEWFWKTILLFLTLFMAFLLAVNLNFIVKSKVFHEKAPGIFGIVPLVVLSDSMFPTFESGDLLLFQEGVPVSEGDIAAFYDPESESDVIVSHRVVSVSVGSDGTRLLKTKGDANNTEDHTEITDDLIIGKYMRTLKQAGSWIMYLQTGKGMVLIVFVPIILLFLLELLRKTREGQIRNRENKRLQEELLKARAQISAEADAGPQR